MAALWACGGWRDAGGVSGMLDGLEWQSLGARGDRSSLLLFHWIHSGAVSIDRDGCLTAAHGFGSARSSHCAQCYGCQTYSDALRGSFFPTDCSAVEWSFSFGGRFQGCWGVWGTHHLVKNTAERFFLYFCFDFVFLFCFFFFKIPNSHSLA